MNTRRFTIFFSIIFLFCFISCEYSKPSKHSVRMFMTNAEHDNLYDNVAISTVPQTLWTYKTGAAVISSPVVSNNSVFIGSEDGRFYSLNALTGTLNWEFETGGPVNSSPAIANEMVFFLSYDGYFYALKQINGELVWKFKTEGESRHLVKDYFNKSFKPDFWDFYLSSPVVADNLVCFGSSDQHVYALDLKNGNLKWKYKTSGRIHSSPASSNKHIVVGSWDSNVYCLKLESGKEKWVFETGKDTAQYIWLGVQASPTISGSTVYIGSRDARYYALDLYSGDTIWTKNEFDMSWMPSSSAADDNALYTGSSDSFAFFSIDKKTGDINYKTMTNAYTFSSPVIDDEMAYIGAANGLFYGIELKSGKVKWTYRTQGIASDTIKMFKSDGTMNAMRMQELFKGITNMPQLSALYSAGFSGSGAILSSPTISGGNVYFGSSDGFVYALTQKNE